MTLLSPLLLVILCHPVFSDVDLLDKATDENVPVDKDLQTSLLDDSDTMNRDLALFNDTLKSIEADFTKSGEDDNDCLPSDTIQTFRDATNCGAFYEICSKNNSVNLSQDLSRLGVLKQCESGMLFDLIDMKCLPPETVDCNITEFVCPGNDAFVADTKRLSWFIECHNDTGERSRHECQPHGTVFDSETQSCVKPPLTEPFLIAVLRRFVRFMIHTKHSMSPWIEVGGGNKSSSVQHHADSSDPAVSKKADILTKTEDGGDISVEDQAEIFTTNTEYIILYYSVIAGIPLLFVLLFLIVTCIIFKICWRPEESKEFEFADEFYRYEPNDSYLTTRM